MEVCFSGTLVGTSGRDAQPWNSWTPPANRPNLFWQSGGADRHPAVVSSQQRRNFPYPASSTSILTQTSTPDRPLPPRNNPAISNPGRDHLLTSPALCLTITAHISQRDPNLKRAVSCTALRLLSFQTAAVEAKINSPPFPSLPRLQALNKPPRLHALQPQPAQRRSADPVDVNIELASRRGAVRGWCELFFLDGIGSLAAQKRTGKAAAILLGVLMLAFAMI